MSPTEYSDEFKSFTKDPNRYIAHAGGVIDGITYTNSLESLNNSYQNGFRLFELDILVTSDQHFVAVHDWNSWKKNSSYSGSVPPTKDAFMSHRIFGYLTPLDMKAINQWFEAHPDAILVTDKINNPTRFAAAFIDNSRLKMELFTWQAVNEGLKTNINAVMPNGHLLKSIKGDPVDFLLNQSINELVVSRKVTLNNPNLMERLLENDIKIYAYNINSKGGKGEQKVACFERHLIYGMYADTWDFEANINCNLLTPHGSNKANQSKLKP